MSVHEFSYYLYCSIASYGYKPSFVRRSALPDGGFASLYAVTKETAEAIAAEGTTKGFKGIVWSENLWVDVDSYDGADRTERILKNLGLRYRAYDSGGRGAHFEIARKATASHLLPSLDKYWVKENLPEADTSIYTHLHPFRLPGTVHERTGEKKIMVNSVSGTELILLRKEAGANFWDKIGTDARLTTEASIFDSSLVMLNSVPCERGQRHSQLVKLCYALKDEAGVSAQIAYWWLNEVNKLFLEPKQKEELEKIFSSIYGEGL